MIKLLDAEFALELAVELEDMPIDSAPRSGKKRTKFIRQHKDDVAALLRRLAAEAPGA